MAAKNLSHLKGILEKHVENVKKQAGKIVRETSVTILRELVDTTPVDTGKAISNWLVGINLPDEDSIYPHVPGRYGDTLDANVEAAFSIGEALIDGRKTFGEPIYISNNAYDVNRDYEYLGDFNYDRRNYRVEPPQQRPNRYFFEFAVQAGREKMEELIKAGDKAFT